MYFIDFLGKDLATDLPNYSKLVQEFYAYTAATPKPEFFHGL